MKTNKDIVASSTQPTPGKFKQQNMVLTAPNCGDLPVCKTDDGYIISKWNLSLIQRLRVLIFGSVWLGIKSAHSQPPLWIDTDNPFVKN